ncbi:integron integrase, partial [Stieleria varia]
LTARDVESHLTNLAVKENLAENSQDQAFYAILYLFTHVLKRELKEVNAIRSTKPKRVPVVMSRPEVRSVLSHLSGVYFLMAQLMYGTGMRLGECLRLRVKDIDFDNRMIYVRRSKGKKDRRVPLPETVVESLQKKLQWRRKLHDQDLAEGVASVFLPKALDRKYPNAHREFRWQFIFASHRLSRNPRDRRMHRHHLHKKTFPDHLKRAVEKAGIEKQITSHVFRHSFATHLLASGTDIRTIQELLGHADVKTTMIYLHCLSDPSETVKSPLDRLNEGIVDRNNASEHVRAQAKELELHASDGGVAKPRNGGESVQESSRMQTHIPDQPVIDRGCVESTPPLPTSEGGSSRVGLMRDASRRIGTWVAVHLRGFGKRQDRGVASG